MSLLPLIRDPLDHFRPSLIPDQHFGMGLHSNDFLEPCVPRRVRRWLMVAPYSRNWRSQASKRDKGSTVSIDKDGFQVTLDVQQFAPEDIKVKASGDTITIEGKHEEKEDEHGFISRQFVRRYTLPEGHDINHVESKLSSDGVLTIIAPKEQKDEEIAREIPITIIGRPSQSAIEGGKDENKKPEEKRDSRKKK